MQIEDCRSSRQRFGRQVRNVETQARFPGLRVLEGLPAIQAPVDYRWGQRSLIHPQIRESLRFSSLRISCAYLVNKRINSGRDSGPPLPLFLAYVKYKRGEYRVEFVFWGGGRMYFPFVPPAAAPRAARFPA